jgi:hypothetical protein
MNLDPPPSPVITFDSSWRTWLAFLYNFLTIEDWHLIGDSGEPAFENSWVNQGTGDEDAAYYKDPYGIVHLRGQVDTGTSGTAVFTLPEGYRSSAQKQFPADADSSSTYARVQINSNGAVVPYFNAGGAATRFSLDGVSFRV